jgi:hypothetical protein
MLVGTSQNWKGKLMSHFAVLVIGNNVEEQLAPYHEFESTGEDNQYVQAIDKTEEARKEFETATTKRYRDPEGNLHSPFTSEGNWDQKFWRELTPEEEALYGKKSYIQDYEDNPEHGGLRLYSTDWHDGKNYHIKAFAWPSEGWSEVEVLKNTVVTFAEFCKDYYGHEVVPFGQQPDFEKKHKYGYTLVDCEGNVTSTVDRTNPKRKWDWYSVGGRWNGFFKLKVVEHEVKYPDGAIFFEKRHATGVLGQPGAHFGTAPEPPTEDRADVLMKGDIDIEGMREEAASEAYTRYTIFATVTYGLPQAISWRQIQEKHRTGETDKRGEPVVDWDAARKEYNGQPMVVAMRENDETRWFELEDFLVTREEYVQRFRNSALVTFAVLKDGVWYERGSMGWWGMVANEQDRNAWNEQVTALIDSLPDDTLMTVVDCHI